MIVRTTCARDCPDSCFMDARVEDGRLVSVSGGSDNPVTAGFVCPRGVSDPERVYSAERILHPLVRKGQKPGRGLMRISWDEALDIIATRLRRVLAERGPGGVLLLDYSGNTGLLSTQLSLRPWNALGATRTDYSVCSSSGHAALGLHYGLSYGMQPEGLLGMGVVVFWGFNPRVSSPHQWALALRARRERGAMIVVVDVRRSESAKAADLWLAPRQGSDVALAYGVARSLILRGEVDRAFLERWTSGFDDYAEEARRWTPDRVQESTGIPGESVEALAEALAARKPAALMIGIGLQKCAEGAESVRAVSLLPALLGEHRGFYYTNSQGRYIDYSRLTGAALSDRKPNVVSQVAVGERLEAGEFGFVYVQGMNPALTLPAIGAVRRGLSRDDVFMVVHDTHLTETSEYADVVLPAPTFLERRDVVVSDSHPYIQVSEKAVDPLGESWDEVRVSREIARRIGLSETWMFEDPWSALGAALEDVFADGGYDDLLGGRTLTLRSRPRDEYQTPSGRIEFYSSLAEREGHSPLPRQMPVSLHPGEFVMLSSAVAGYTHSQFRDVHGPIPCVAWMNPSDAASLGLRDGEDATLHNSGGGLSVRVSVTDGVPAGVLWTPRPLTDGSGRPQNALVPPGTQGIGCGPFFNSTRVCVRKGT